MSGLVSYYSSAQEVLEVFYHDYYMIEKIYFLWLAESNLSLIINFHCSAN